MALLVERKIIDKESFVFIDEPEAHLHPAWQVVMAESLFELAKGGVNVVIATHSADILKWLEVHIKKNPDDESLVALNKFPSNDVETDEQDFRDKIAGYQTRVDQAFRGFIHGWLMNSLDKFLEPIKVAGKSMGNKYKAYKMDSNVANNNMRKMVGLGTCHCCDYFLPNDNSITLIEETQLLKTVEDIREEYDYLNDKDKKDVVNVRIREEIQLKAYGAMLVLCRLAAKCANAKQLFRDKKYHFWLVARQHKFR